MNRFLAPVAAAVLCLSGCVVPRTETSGPAQHESAVFERDSTPSLHVDLNMGAGNLRVGTGTEKLVRADFDYSNPSWKPQVRLNAGNLTISQPETHGVHLGSNRYDWDIRLNRDVPLEINTHFGAGEAHLDLGGLDLRRVQVDMGVGKMQMDLRGQTRHDYEVSIHGGVGEATVYLPSDAGIYADASGGIGEIRTPGLHKEESHYTNDAYGKAKYTVRLNVQGGIGSIRLIAE